MLKISTRSIHWQTIALVVLALVVRFSFSSLSISLSQDSARDVLLVKQAIADNQLVAFYGPKVSVYNFYLPPLYNQLTILAHSIYDSPLVMKWLITLLESSTPAVLFLVLSHLISRKSAFVASALYILFAQPMIYGTSAWNPNLLPLLSTIALLGWVLFFKCRKRIGLLIATIATCLTVQFHFQAVLLFLFPMVLGFILLLRRDVRSIKMLVVGAIIGLLFLFPYLYAEITTNFQNTRAMIGFSQSEHSNYFDRVSWLEFGTTYFPAFFQRIIIGMNHIPGLPSWLNALHPLGTTLTILGGIALLLKARHDRSARWLIVYFLCIAIMLRVYKGDKLDYYLQVLFVAPAILLGYTLDRWRKLGAMVLLATGASVLTFLHLFQPSVSLLQMKADARVIRAHTSSQTIKPLIFSAEKINATLFLLHEFAELKIESNSQTMTVLCNLGEDCMGGFLPRCELSAHKSYLNDLLQINQLERSVRIPLGASDHMWIFDFAAPIVLPETRLYEQLGTGHDIVYPAAIDW